MTSGVATVGAAVVVVDFVGVSVIVEVVAEVETMVVNCDRFVNVVVKGNPSINACCLLLLL